MPKLKNRGKLLRTRTRKVGKDKYQRCDIYEKKGPHGGKTVCGPVKTKRGKK